MQRKGPSTDTAAAGMTSVAAPSSPSNSSLAAANTGISSTASLPPTNHAHFTPRPPPAHTKTSAAVHSPSAALPALTLPASMGNTSNNLNTNGGNIPNNPTGSPAPFSQATPPPQLAKPPSVVTRLPYNPRKLSAATPTNEVRIESPAVAPNSPNSASARLPFTPSTPNASILPSTPLTMTNSLLPPAQHAPSPLGSAYDEVRIPTSELLPSTSTTQLQKIPSVNSGLNSMDSTPSVLSLPSAHQVVPLPTDFYRPSPATPSTSSAAVNLPNILIPPSPALPSPILWSQANQLAAENNTTSNTTTPTAPTSPGATSTTPSMGLFPTPSPNAAAAAAATAGESSANNITSPAWPAQHIGAATATNSNSQSSTAPFGTSSMDSRQWAQLLLKYRASGDGIPNTAAAASNPAPSSRSNAANNVSIVHTLAQSNPSSSAVSPTAGATSNSVNTSSTVIAPLFPSPNVLTSSGVSRPPSSRGKSRPQSHRGTGEEHEGDPEKQAMANELNRLRAVIAMQTHAQQTAAIAAANVNSSSSSAALFSTATLPAPLASTPTFPPNHPSPSTSTPISHGGGGPGLSWNTAFAALSNTFLQQHPSPSPQPIAQHTPLHIAGNTTPFNASDMNFTPLPSPAVVDSSAALSHPDYRSTFRSMSMLIRSGSAAHAISTNTSHAASPFPPHPPAITHLIRSRSAEDSSHVSSHHHHSRQPPLDASASFHSISTSSSSNNIAATITTTISTVTTTTTTPAGGAAAPMDEIEEDLLPPRGSFEAKEALKKEQQHLRATLSKSTPLSPRHMSNGSGGSETGLAEEEKDLDLGDVYAQQHAQEEEEEEEEDGDASQGATAVVGVNAPQTDSDEQIEIEEESHLRRNDSEEPDSPNLPEIEMEDENNSGGVSGGGTTNKNAATAAALHRMHASPPPLTSQVAGSTSNHSLLFPSPTTASAASNGATSIHITAAPTTALSIAASPVSSPPPSASGSSFRKTPRAFACADAQCVERQRKDRAELIRSFAEENQALKQRHAAAIKSIETRLRREIQLKDNRVQQLEKIQAKLLQPHSKLVQQNEELLAYIARLQQQVQELGVNPLPMNNATTTSTAPSEKSSPAFKSRKLNNNANHNNNSNNIAANIVNGHSSSLNASPTSAQSNLNAPDMESSPVSGIVENDITPSAARSSPFSFIESQPVHQQPQQQQAEPFFNTSAPRTVTGKARRRSQSFANGGERTGTAGKGGGHGGRQQHSPAAASLGVAVEGFAVGSGVSASSAASSTSSPRSSIINTMVAAPPRPSVTQFHSGRQRKTSIKAKDLPPSGSHQNLAALEAVSAPVTTRKAHIPRPQAAVTVVQ